MNMHAQPDSWGSKWRRFQLVLGKYLSGFPKALSGLGKDRASLRRPLMIGGVLVVALVAAIFWLMGGRYVSTEDAYISAPKLMVAADVSGTVSDVNVREGQIVKKGDVLFRLEQQPFQIAVDSAQSQLQQTVLDVQSLKHQYQSIMDQIAAQQAQTDLARSVFNREASLLKAEAISQADYDEARASLAAAQSKLNSLQADAREQLAKLNGNIDITAEQLPAYLSAKAKLDQAKRDLDHSVVRAPFDGMVTQVSSLQPGTIVVSSMASLVPTSAVGLVSTTQLWVDAQLKETDLTYVKEGAPVEISVDSFPGHVWHGTVQSIAPATESQFSVLPAQNSSGNWVKVVQRFQVRLAFDPKEDLSRLRSGMSTNVKIDTGRSRSLF
jgi:membrane fusion protein (multidrug efflux system)